MRFEEQAIATRRHRRPREIRHHAPVAAAAGTRCHGRRRLPWTAGSWHLYAVSAVKDHGTTKILHPGNRTHVVDEVAVTERAAALGEQQPAIAHLGHLGDDV